MNKLLIIEDDVGIAESLKLYLESSGFEVELCFDGLKAIKKINNYKPDLIILDINLPGKNGIEICKEVRGNSSLSIIMLTARSSELDRITGLEIGADDYIAKPFSPRELLARINTIFRRYKKDPKVNINNIIYKNLRLDKDKKIVYVDDKEVSLTSNEYELFRTILENNGKIISREILMKKVMGYENYIYDRTLDTHIKNLRKKIGIKDLILTIRGKGYRLNK